MEKDAVMARPTTDERERSLQVKLTQVKQQLADIKARQSARRRKEDTRLKVIVGAALLADALRHEETADCVRRVVSRAITAPRDREFLAYKGLLTSAPESDMHRA